MFSIYLGWWLIIPPCLALLYGFTSYRAMRALGYRQNNTLSERLEIALPAMILFAVWGIADIPLPLFYIFAFIIKLFRLINGNNERPKELFLINITHLTTMAMHMILIGVISLVSGIPMYELLQQPFWRISTISAILIINIVFALLLPNWIMILGILRTQSERAEVRSFMVFLWFCNLFLLLDSVLCISRIEWNLLPLFLIGSTVLLEFYLLRFLRHLYLILKVQYLEEEHHKLICELEQQNRTAEEWRNKSIMDSMTGIFSRRYVIKQIELFLQEKEPFSLVFIDLDHLKLINDSEGHQAGDLYIIGFVKEVSAYLRRSDIFARFGGDEFVILLPGCSDTAAEKKMNDIRDNLLGKFNPPLSFSFGVIYIPENTSSTADQIIKKADKKMYKYKQKRIK